MNVQTIRQEQKWFIITAITSFIILFLTNLITFEETNIEILNIIVNTLAAIIFLLSAWVTSYYYGMLEAKGEKKFFEAGTFILLSGIIPGAIAFFIGKRKGKK